VVFLEALAQDLKSRPAEWENNTLERYIEALARWVADSGGYYRGQGLDVPVSPTWKNVAEMLLAAKMYE
jgi:hypothetical protein